MRPMQLGDAVVVSRGAQFVRRNRGFIQTRYDFDGVRRASTASISAARERQNN